MRWKDIPDGILHTVIKYPVKNGMGEEASIICELAQSKYTTQTSKFVKLMYKKGIKATTTSLQIVKK